MWVTICGYVTGCVTVRYGALRWCVTVSYGGALRLCVTMRYFDALRRCVTVRYGALRCVTLTRYGCALRCVTGMWRWVMPVHVRVTFSYHNWKNPWCGFPQSFDLVNQQSVFSWFTSLTKLGLGFHRRGGDPRQLNAIRNRTCTFFVPFMRFIRCFVFRLLISMFCPLHCLLFLYVGILCFARENVRSQTTPFILVGLEID